MFFSASATSIFWRRIFGSSRSWTRIPRRVALSAYAGPMPRRVVPICSLPSRRSLARSIATCHGMIRCALPETRTVDGRDAARLELVELLDEDLAGRRRSRRRCTHSLPAQDPRGHLPELVRLAVGDDRVARVRAALVTADEVGVLGEQVDDLALALVTPLRADDHGRRHASTQRCDASRSLSGLRGGVRRGQAAGFDAAAHEADAARAAACHGSARATPIRWRPRARLRRSTRFATRWSALRHVGSS